MLIECLKPSHIFVDYPKIKATVLYIRAKRVIDVDSIFGKETSNVDFER